MSSYDVESEIARLDAESHALASRARDEPDAGAREYLEALSLIHI